MKAEELKSKIEAGVSGAKLKIVRETILVEEPSQLSAIATFLRDDESLKLDYISSLTGADYLTFLECVYHLYSMEKKTEVVILRVRVPRDNPKLPSVTPIWRGAEYQEREAYDMYGFQFEGHPDHRRIFMWEGFEGFPMRKDYVQEDSETLEDADIEWLEKHNIEVSDEIKEKAAQPKEAPATGEEKA